MTLHFTWSSFICAVLQRSDSSGLTDNFLLSGIYVIKSAFWLLVVPVILVAFCNSADLSKELVIS
jgi:hypothetical protein